MSLSILRFTVLSGSTCSPFTPLGRSGQGERAALFCYTSADRLRRSAGKRRSKCFLVTHLDMGYTEATKRGSTVMATVRHVEDDPIEMLFERGATDGLPVVPPTRERVERMLAGAPDRQREELIGTLGPCYGEATVEKVAINAVMAGCKPEYFPVVLAGVEALCDERFCAH